MQEKPILTGARSFLSRLPARGNNVRSESTAAEMGVPRYVRFTLDSDRRADIAGCLKRANNGLMHRSKQHRHSITSSARSDSDVGTSMRPCRLEE
jgi:hypothetical protein